MEDKLKYEIELENGDKFQMKIQEPEDWSEIEKGTKALIILVNGQKMLVEINEADEDEGVSFNIIDDNRIYHYDSDVISLILTKIG